MLQKGLRSVQLDKINHCFPFIFFYLYDVKEQEILRPMYLVSKEKNVWTLKKMWGEKIFFSCWVSGQGVTTARLLSVYSEPKNNCGCGFQARVNELNDYLYTGPTLVEELG